MQPFLWSLYSEDLVFCGPYLGLPIVEKPCRVLLTSFGKLACEGYRKVSVGSGSLAGTCHAAAAPSPLLQELVDYPDFVVNVKVAFQSVGLLGHKS